METIGLILMCCWIFYLRDGFLGMINDFLNWEHFGIFMIILCWIFFGYILERLLS